jgi:16S rRNA (guanine527-N7)-methyltransferase
MRPGGWSSGRRDATVTRLAGSMTSELQPALEAVLERSRRLGFLGPGSLRVQAEHALGFAAGLSAPPGRYLDLGSGGGVPGLVLALHWSSSQAVLLDASERRFTFLVEAVEDLGCGDRVTVVRSRAEDAGRRPDMRGGFDAVVARSFGPPGTTAECGAPFLIVGGRLVVSEPPLDEADDSPERWPSDGLARLGLGAAEEWRSPYRYRSFVLERTCPEAYPRRNGVPAKRPLF